jgi:hypothetical protein
MTVNQTKERIEKELLAVKESFGDASYLVDYSVEIEENNIEGAPVDITCVFGSLSIGPEGSEGNDRLYLPLDAELDDEDNVDEKMFEENLELFKERVDEIREAVLSSDDYNAAVNRIIADFDSEMERKYQAEIERLNRISRRNLIIAAVATAIAGVAAIIILVAQKLM